MKTLLAVWLSSVIGATAGAAYVAEHSGESDEAMCQVTCSPAQMVNVRLDAADCLAGGSAAHECLERARLEYCQ